MSDNLVTVATFNTPAEAQLAKNVLEEEGIKSMIADEEVVGMAWYIGNAVGGVKLLVLEHDWMKARATIAQHQEKLDEEMEADGAEDYGEDQEVDEHISESPGRPSIPEDEIERQIAEKPMQLGSTTDAGEEKETVSEGEDLARRAYLAAVFGIIFTPYSMWLLWRLANWKGELSTAGIIKVLLAIAFNAFYLVVFRAVIGFVIG